MHSAARYESASSRNRRNRQSKLYFVRCFERGAGFSGTYLKPEASGAELLSRKNTRNPSAPETMCCFGGSRPAIGCRSLLRGIPEANHSPALKTGQADCCICFCIHGTKCYSVQREAAPRKQIDNPLKLMYFDEHRIRSHAPCCRFTETHLRQPAIRSAFSRGQSIPRVRRRRIATGQPVVLTT